MQSPSLVTHCSMGHSGGSPQAPCPEQSVLQTHESLQSTPLAQVPRAVQPTSHGPPPQVIGPAQASVFAHSTVQLVASEQSTPPMQEPAPVHRT